MLERSLRTGPLSKTEQHDDNAKLYFRCLRAGPKAGEVLCQLEKIPPPPKKEMAQRNVTQRIASTRLDPTRPDPNQPGPGRVATIISFHLFGKVANRCCIHLQVKSHDIPKISLCHCIAFTCDALLNVTSKDNICTLK